MQPTSNERREVANKLRKLNINSHIKGDRQFVNELDDVVNVYDGTYTYYGLLNVLADLIDPTCENYATKQADEFLCSECGEHVDIAYMENTDDYHAKYCPHCGARVIN